MFEGSRKVEDGDEETTDVANCMQCAWVNHDQERR